MARGVLVCTMMLLAMGAFAQPSSEPAVPAKDFVVICPVEGLIDDGVTVFVKRAIREAYGAKAIIFVVDTFGGKVDSAIEISNAILNAPCKTIAYIKGKGAISAGALISFSCNTMVMEPGSAIGAATPVIAGPQGMEPTSEKEVSFMRAKMRALAERNGHNPDIAQAMVDKDIGLRGVMQGGKWVVYAENKDRAVSTPPAGAVKDIVETILKAVKEAGGVDLPDVKPKPAPEAAPADQTPAKAPDGSEVVLPVGKLLTMTPNEAVKYGVISTTVVNLEQVMGVFDVPNAEKHVLAMSWNELIFRFLTNPLVSGILLMLGVGGIYFEMKAPGHTLPGVVGVVCLAIFFGSYALIGLADWFDVILVVVGVVLILVEIFVVPGVTFLGGAGLVCIILGLYLALTGAFIPEFAWDYARLQNAMVTAMVAGVALSALVYLSWKYLPRTPLFQGILMTYTQGPAKGYVVQTEEQRAIAEGLVGVATSKLRPAGRGRFGDTTYDVVSNSEYIEPGEPIVIVQADGNRYVVDRYKGAK
ncbi:MAG: hypothetical protein HZB26_12700 [Candidatus Hydrogenedentes bacterium]|nr:hypothetical protein [Candidatus Hydrogenedentota bacterium]